jgi:predicted RNase H-like HicB family nuclease
MGAQTYHVVLKEDENGWYAVQCVELPGAISQGRTREEALVNIKEAIELLLEHYASKVAGQRVEEVVVAT